MPSMRRLTRPFRSARTWIALGVLAPAGMLAASGLMLLDLRQDAWDKAEQTSKNLLQVIRGNQTRILYLERYWLNADAPEPRAWDYLWRPGVQGVVRIRLKSGPWLAGVFGTTASGQRSYAAGYPEKEDLYLSLQVKVDSNGKVKYADFIKTILK